MADDHTDLAIIGGGPAGYTAAFLAADLGMAVTLIDPQKNPGGTCLYRGCIPSKALLHVARLVHEAQAAASWGIAFGRPKIDLERLRAWKEDVVGNLTGGLGRLAGKRKIRHIQGIAVFQDNHTLTIRRTDGSEQHLAFERAIIASGSKATALGLLPFDPDRIWKAKTALDLPTIPKRLLVIGGGYISLELGPVYAALGSKVTVVEMTPTLLPGVDRDLVRFLKKSLDGRFEQILLETKVTKAAVQKTGVKITFEGPECDTGFHRFDNVLVAVGRRPNCENLG